MQARDVTCPECGEGLKDVEPETDLSYEAVEGQLSQITHAMCLGGHEVVITSCELGDEVGLAKDGPGPLWKAYKADEAEMAKPRAPTIWDDD